MSTETSDWKLGAFVLFLVVAVVGTILYFKFDSMSGSTVQGEQASAPAPVQMPRRTAPAGQSVYYGDAYDFSFLYPSTAKVEEYKEGGGAMTLVVEDIENARGLQVFILPYKEAKISEERFKADIPSGIRTDVKDIQIGGVKAVTFLSGDPLIGETREVWFIKGGYLFEVTTTKDAGDWLSPIMASWQFR